MVSMKHSLCLCAIYMPTIYVSMLLPRIHQAAAALLQAPTEPVNDSTYFECLDVVADKSQVCACGGRECGWWQTFHTHLCGSASCTLLLYVLCSVPLHVAV